MQKKCVFTIVHNENYFLPLWLNHYGRFFKKEDIYILDDDTQDGSTYNLNANVVKLNNKISFNHGFMLATVMQWQRRLLKEYENVLFTEVDEFIVPHPDKKINLGEFIDGNEALSVRCDGWHILQDVSEPAIVTGTPVMHQRKYGGPHKNSCKVLLSKVPLTWCSGFHNDYGLPISCLILVHLHHFDIDIAFNRQNHRLMRETEKINGMGDYNKVKLTKKDLESRVFKAKKDKLPEYFSRLDLPF